MEISKPKRISLYSGVSQFMFIPSKNVLKKGSMFPYSLTTVKL
tara:strand:- start:67 stop:195 length:129 start_codon:yes stop_codon:yes gene_type:complete